MHVCIYYSLPTIPSTDNTHVMASLDVTVKAQLFHNSTRVCMLKRKTNISLKKTTAPPLASFQFEIDITNLALQVSGCFLL